MSTPVTPDVPAPKIEIPQFSTPTRYIIGVLLFAFSILGLFLLRPVVTSLLLAFIIAFVLYLPVRSLTRHTRLSYAGSVVVIYLIIGLILLFLLFTLVPAVIDGINSLTEQLQVAGEDFTQWMEEYEPGDAVITILGNQIDLDPIIQAIMPLFQRSSQPPDSDTTTDDPDSQTDPTDSSTDAGTTAAQDIQLSMPNLGEIMNAAGEILGLAGGALAGFISNVASFVATLFLALFISFLTLLDLGNMHSGLFRLIHIRFEREVKIILGRLDKIWLGFFKSQVLIGLLLGVLAYIQYILLGVPGALPLAIFNGFFSVIPTIGGLISIIPQVIVTMLLGSTRFPDMDHLTFTLINVIIGTIYSQFIYSVVSPPLVGKYVKLPVVVVVVGVFVGLALGGILAAFLVVPVISTVKLLFVYFMAKVRQSEPFPDETVPETGGFFSQIASEKPH